MEGYVGLFFGSLIAATIIPLSSEAMLAGVSALGTYDTVGLWLAASTGNTLGSIINWMLGRWLLRFRGRRWFPVSDAALARGQDWFSRWGLWSLLLAWLPFVGDPLTVAAGTLRVPFGRFVVLVAIGKAARFAALLYAAEWFFPIAK